MTNKLEQIQGCGKDITVSIKGVWGPNKVFNGCIRLFHTKCGKDRFLCEECNNGK